MKSRLKKTPRPGAQRYPSQALRPHHQTSVCLRIKKFTFFHHKRHHKEISTGEVQAFLTYLPLEEHNSASTLNQALSALLFMYRNVLRQELGPVESEQAKTSLHMPTALSRAEVQTVSHKMIGIHLLMACF